MDARADDVQVLLDRAAQRWSLEIGPPFPHSTNYVARAVRPDGTRCVLKLGRAGESSELEALRVWDGRGAVQVLDAAPEDRAMLLEWIEPGNDLAGLAEEDDDAATIAAAGILRQLWRPSADGDGIRALRDWFGPLLDSSGVTDALLERGQRVARELFATAEAPVILHGDLSHFNILAARRAPWLAIDPTGFVGERGFDLAAFLRDPAPLPLPTLSRRLRIFCETLSLDPTRSREWCFAEATLNARRCQIEDPAWLPDRLEWAELTLRL
jgi:streptomycin 6-kinase